MQSMTGYGSGRAKLGDGEIILELRTVNHRFLDARVRLPSRFQSRSQVVERVARKRLVRGRVDATVRVEGQTAPAPALDLTRARSVYGDLRSLRDELSPDEPVPLALLSCVPDLFVVQGGVDDEALDQALELATNEACAAVESMRVREGTALKTELTQLLDQLASAVEAIRKGAPELVLGRQSRLRDRVKTLLRDVDVQPDSSRLEQEIALLAERSDITEELTRLDSHDAQMRELFETSDGPVGKRIDFLLQEMAREANTIGAKAQGSEVTPQVIALKACIEQMREQSQNVL